MSEGQPVAPLYFAFAADANRRPHDLLDDHRAPPVLDVASLERCQREAAVVIDTRSPDVFASGHLRGSINVPLDARFAEYAGDVARPGEPIVVVTDPGRETEARVRLARIGFDRVRGAVIDIERILTSRPDLAVVGTRVAAADFATWRADAANLQIVDVRNPSEQQAGMLPGAVSMPLPTLLDGAGALDPDVPTVVYCASGVRSSIAASLLRAKGFAPVADVLGGYEAWRAAGSTSAA